MFENIVTIVILAVVAYFGYHAMKDNPLVPFLGLAYIIGMAVGFYRSRNEAISTKNRIVKALLAGLAGVLIFAVLIWLGKGARRY
jgi:uncharacterized membrane protein